MAFQKPNRTTPPNRSPNGPDPYTLGNDSTSSLATSADDNKLTSLGRIKKRNRLQLQSSESRDSPSHSQADVAQSQFTPLSETTREQKHANAPTNPLYAGADKRSLHFPRTPINPLQDPARMYQNPRVIQSSNDLPVSYIRRRSVLSMKGSSTRLRGHLVEDIWEQASRRENKSVTFKEKSETTSLPESKKKSAISTSFRRGFDRVMRKNREEIAAFSTTNYIANVEARHPSLRDYRPYRSSPLAPLDPKSRYASSPMAAGLHGPRSIRNSSTYSKRLYRTANNVASSPVLSDRSFESTPPCVRNHATRGQHNDENFPSTPSSLLSKRPSLRFSPSPLFGQFLTRNRSSEHSIELSSPSPVCTTSAPQNLEKASNCLKIMQPKTTYSQKPAPGSSSLSVMAPLIIVAQTHIPPPTNISLTGATTIFSQAPTPLEDTLDWLFVFFILSLLLMTFQALAFAINHVNEKTSKGLMGTMLYEYLMGIALGFLLHTHSRRLPRLLEDIKFSLARVVGIVLRLFRRVVGKIVEGVRAGIAEIVEEI